MNQFSWSEAIERILVDNNGSASLERMYADIRQYRDVSNNSNWKATLRGILYRDIREQGRIVRVGLGVYGFADGAAAQHSVARIDGDSPTLLKPASRHSATQGMLIELGSFYGYDTYTADPNSTFNGKVLSSLTSLNTLPAFTGFGDLLEQARKIDVLWFSKGTKRPFPKFAIEVEHTPEFRRSLLKLYQLRDFDTRFVLIADESKKHVFDTRLDNDPFHENKTRFAFRTFDSVNQLYAVATQHFLLKERFFDAV